MPMFLERPFLLIRLLCALLITKEVEEVEVEVEEEEEERVVAVRAVV